jgi:hypothetical protein
MVSDWRLLPRLVAPVGCALLLWLVAGCGEPTSPGASVTIVSQPSQALVGAPLSPSLEVEVLDDNGDPATGVVSVSLDPNPCGFTLAGTLTAGVVAGRASFSGLSFTQAGKAQVLKVTYQGASGMTSPVDVRAVDAGLPIEQENTLCLKPNPQKDAESLAFVPEDDAFWIADDNRPSIFQIDRSTGRYLSQLSAESIVAALPTAGMCDDGDGDPNTTCSYVDEFEHVVYDRPRQRLYVLNTVNSEEIDPVVDKAAIFILKRGTCAGCFVPESWQPLPDDYHSGPMGLIDGEIHVALANRIYRYDIDGNRLLTVDSANDSIPPVLEISGQIHDFQQEGMIVWVLHGQELVKVDRATGAEVARYGIQGFGLGDPHGMQVVEGGIYVLDGTAPNPIYVFRSTQ